MRIVAEFLFLKWQVFCRNFVGCFFEEGDKNKLVEGQREMLVRNYQKGTAVQIIIEADIYFVECKLFREKFQDENTFFLGRNDHVRFFKNE